LYESGRWAFALALIDHLPRTSSLAAAIADDDEMADAEVRSAPATPAHAAPVPMTEFSPEVEALAALMDRLGELINTEIALKGGKPSSVKPYPRPVTAFDRARARLSADVAHSMESKLFRSGGSEN
jgi:hypothetical protein